jgi:hypothetical protein
LKLPELGDKKPLKTIQTNFKFHYNTPIILLTSDPSTDTQTIAQMNSFYEASPALLPYAKLKVLPDTLMFSESEETVDILEMLKNDLL